MRPGSLGARRAGGASNFVSTSSSRSITGKSSSIGLGIDPAPAGRRPSSRHSAPGFRFQPGDRILLGIDDDDADLAVIDRDPERGLEAGLDVAGDELRRPLGDGDDVNLGDRARFVRVDPARLDLAEANDQVLRALYYVPIGPILEHNYPFSARRAADIMVHCTIKRQ